MNKHELYLAANGEADRPPVFKANIGVYPVRTVLDNLEQFPLASGRSLNNRRAWLEALSENAYVEFVAGYVFRLVYP